MQTVRGNNNFWFLAKIHSVQPCVGVDQMRVLEQVKAVAGELEKHWIGRTQNNIFNSGFHLMAWS